MQQSDATLARLAARNNAEWCQFVARGSHIDSRMTDEVWTADAPMPPGYPEAVTLVPRARLDWAAIRGGGQGISVKDSFADQDLSEIGYHELFAAHWIAFDRPALESTVPWRRVSADRLETWVEEHGEASAIQPRLLDVAEIAVVESVRDDDEFVAGAILTLSDDVIGLGNVFLGDVDPVEAWRSLAALAHERFGHAPVVGWETDDTLAPAIEAGFRTVGPLRVWASDGIPAAT